MRPDRGPGVAVKLGVDERIEIVATVLLALATVATAWSGYQASRWNGEQAKAFSRGAAARIESAKAAGLANAQTQVDVATFTQWVDAYALERTELADFYFARFRMEFAGRRRLGGDTAAQERERAADAVRDARVPARGAAGGGSARGGRGSVVSQGRENVQRATNYVLGVVLFAAVLFFAGISTKLRTPALRRVLLGFGVVLFLGTAAWLATFPVSVSIWCSGHRTAAPVADRASPPGGGDRGQQPREDGHYREHDELAERQPRSGGRTGRGRG